MLDKTDTLSVDGRMYSDFEVIGEGANTIAYLAYCKEGDRRTKCILKEFLPHNNEEDYEAGKTRFIASGKSQNKIRQISALTNPTPPVCHVFEANGTAFIDVACYNGRTLDKLTGLSLPQYFEICRTIAKTVEYYHNERLLCLDLKPNNIFVLQNAPDDTVTQLVEFIDFDSIRHISDDADSHVYSYTREWAAPEQINPYLMGTVGFAADIYTVAELLFYRLFGRHSMMEEHRGFSKYPYDACRKEYRKYVDRPRIQALLNRLFRNTLRSSANNRFKTMHEVTNLLDEIITEMNQKEFIIPILPAVSPGFVGRETELRKISESLKENNVLYVTGIGGIGKTTLVKNYIARYRTEYDIIVYLEYDGDFRHSFCDDKQLQISVVSRQNDESNNEYYDRKLTAFRRVCNDRRVLFVIDNFTGMLTKDLSSLFDFGYEMILTTRSQPPKNSFAVLEISALTDASDLCRLISLNLERSLTKNEKASFAEIIEIVHGHTLILELIARQIAVGRIDIHRALLLIRENGFSRFSSQKVGNIKDGEEVYDTLAAIILAIFKASSVDDDKHLVLNILALLDVRGLETSLITIFFPDITLERVNDLAKEGWLYVDQRVSMHPVVAETVRNWMWTVEDVAIMDYHKKVVDIYVGMSNAIQVKRVVNEAEIIKNQHPRHIITAMYYDMLGFYYDVLLNGAYVPENDEERELNNKLVEATELSISHLKQSSDKRKDKYLVQCILSLASIHLRSQAPSSFEKASDLLDEAETILEENAWGVCNELCLFYMVSAWYYTLADPDIDEVIDLTHQAEEVAEQVYHTELEQIDIVYIPTANCLFYLDELQLAADKIEEAVNLCNKFPDMLPYIDKKLELLIILVDIYMALADKKKCQILMTEIEQLNNDYRDQGICREISSEIKEQLQ